MNPEIATMLEDGTYGQRPMTDEEHAHYLEQIKDATPLSNPNSPNS